MKINSKYRQVACCILEMIHLDISEECIVSLIIYCFKGQNSLSPVNLLLLPGKHKTTTTILKPKLKQVLLNTGHDNGHCPYPGFPEYVPKLHQSGVYKGKTHKAKYFPPSSYQGQADILKYFLPMYLPPVCDQAHM